MSRVYTIHIKEEAAKALDKLDKTVRSRIEKKIDALATNPRPAGMKQLAAQKTPAYRIRVGDHRVIYEIRDDELVVLIIRVGNRRDVYKKEL